MPHLLCKSTKTILSRKKITDKLFCLWLLSFWKLLVLLWRGHSEGGLQWKNIKNNSRFIQSVL